MQHSCIYTQKAFILHTRPYRETSVLLELFTQHAGRIHAMAKGIRNTRSSLRTVLQPFIPLYVSWRGQKELVTLRSAEPLDYLLELKGRVLIEGFYLNELLMRLLHHGAPCDAIFELYEETLHQLSDQTHSELIILRRFEKRLLEYLGYGLQLGRETQTSTPVQAENWYKVFPHEGVILSEASRDGHVAPALFKGESLLAIAQEDYASPTILADAKRLMRLMLAPLLGSKPLKTRELIVK